MIVIEDHEVSINNYMMLHNLTNGGVYNRIRKNLVRWRYLFPNTAEYIVIEKDSYVPKKMGRKRNADKL